MTNTDKLRTIPRTCERCGKDFLARPDHVRDGGARFCSRKCGNQDKGRKTVHKPNAHGYLRVTFGGKTFYEHRLVASAVLGRPLLDTEEVHHVDRNRSDNRPEQLMVLPSHAEHMRIEAIQHPRQKRWHTDYDACIVCGRSSVKHGSHGLCVTCNLRKRRGIDLTQPIIPRKRH